MSKSRSGTHLKRIVFKGSAGLENNTWTSLLKPLNTASQWVKSFQLTVRGWRKTWAHKSRCVHTEAERQAAEVFSASCEAKQTSRYSRSWAVPRNFRLLMLHVWAACMRHLFALRSNGYTPNYVTVRGRALRMRPGLHCWRRAQRFFTHTWQKSPSWVWKQRRSDMSSSKQQVHSCELEQSWSGRRICALVPGRALWYHQAASIF